MKIITLSLFMISLLFGIIPIIFYKNEKFKNSMCYCKAITAGLFISIGITHFLQEALEYYASINPNSSTIIFVICAITLLGMEIIEHTGKKINDVSNIMERDKYFSPEEAIKFGLIDKIVENRK